MPHSCPLPPPILSPLLPSSPPILSPLMQKGPKEPILEEAEHDFRPLEECDEHSERDESESEETKDLAAEARKEGSARKNGEHTVPTEVCCS